MHAQNPFASQLHTFGTQVLAANKQLVEWQMGQVKLAEKQAGAAFDAYRAGVEANLAASQTMGKAVLDSVFPVETKA